MFRNGLLLSILVVGLLFLSSTIAFSKIVTKWVEYRSGSDTVRGFIALPEGKGPFPGLIVIHEWWGLNDWIKQNAREFAEHGYAALAVDLYRGKAASNAEEAHELMRGVPEDRAVKDLKAAFTFLAGHPEVDRSHIGSIGWCFGGGHSLSAALNVPNLAASVVCYGRLVSEREEIDRISCPVLVINGGKDRGISQESVREFEKKANTEGKSVQAIIYPDAGHAFMNPNNTQGYRKEDTRDAWSKIYAFLTARLKPAERKK